MADTSILSGITIQSLCDASEFTNKIYGVWKNRCIVGRWVIDINKCCVIGERHTANVIFVKITIDFGVSDILDFLP